MGDALSIEMSFAHLFGLAIGTRGDVNDADVFRVGNHKALAEVLERVAARLDARTKALGLQDDVETNGSPGARISVATQSLRLHARALRESTKDAEGESYQWEVIGSLVGVIAAMLEHYEAA